MLTFAGPGLLLLLTAAAWAGTDTTLVSGDVSGVWDAAGSPYAVVGAVTVPAGCTLLVEPGVEVRFRGRFQFVVGGLLKAVGTEGDSIVFTRDQLVEDHKWKGIRFVESASGCSLAFCRVEYVKNDGPYPEVRGGAVYCLHSAPVISHCRLCHNYSHNENYNGGGGGIFADECSPLVEHCHIFDNYVDSGGGIATIEAGNAMICHCLVEENIALYSGGGMYLGVRSAPTVVGNIVRRNRCSGGWGGGGITLWNWYAMSPVSKTVHSNLFWRNSAADAGGGMYTRYDLSFIYNNTFVGNSASRGGGIYVLNEGAYLPDVRNCIVWENGAGQGASVYLDPANNSDIDVSYSDVQGGWPGLGNFDSVPGFVDTLWFRLASLSRCIDAGTSDATPTEDFEGDGRVDILAAPNRGGGVMPYYDVGWDECTGVGLERGSRPAVAASRPTTTIVRGTQLLAESHACLLDAAGRLVTDPGRGECETRHLAPGVYFLRKQGRTTKALVLR